MDAKIQDELNTIRDIIVQTVPVEQIYLFGSYVYGTPNEDSDLDIYVVLKDDAPMRNSEALAAIWKAIPFNKTISIDLLTIKKNRFDYRLSAPTLEQEVAEKGVLIYG